MLRSHVYRIRKQLSGRNWPRVDESPRAWVYFMPLLGVMCFVCVWIWLDCAISGAEPQDIFGVSYWSAGIRPVRGASIKPVKDSLVVNEK